MMKREMKFSGPLWKTKIFFKAFWKFILAGIVLLLFFTWIIGSIVHSISSIKRQDVIDGSARILVGAESFLNDVDKKIDELKKENQNDKSQI